MTATFSLLFQVKTSGPPSWNPQMSDSAPSLPTAYSPWSTQSTFNMTSVKTFSAKI